MLQIFMSTSRRSNGGTIKTWEVQTDSSGSTDVLVVYEDSKGAVRQRYCLR